MGAGLRCPAPISVGMIKQKGGDGMLLNQAVSKRLLELLGERKMTQYQLYMKSGVPKSTIGNIINCSYDSAKLRILHE